MSVLYILTWPLVVFMVNGIFDKAGIYVAVVWIDMPMHFLGGASIAVAGISFLAFLKKRGVINELPFWVRTFFLISFVAFAAVSWELWEFFLDYVMHSRAQVDLPDTMVDMLLGLLGGFALSILHRIR